VVLEGAGFANAANAGRRMDRRGALHYVCAILLVGEKSEEFRLDQSYLRICFGVLIYIYFLITDNLDWRFRVCV